jgi:hypothetical protein
MPEDLDRGLARLFAEYRDALPDPEPSANFMPRVWQRIEARQNQAVGFRRTARALITAAVALSFAMGAWIVTEPTSSYYQNSYLELLAASDSNDGIGEVEIVVPLERQQ